MPCYKPIEVPIMRKSLYSRGTLDTQVVPCGSCVGCRAEQGRQWGVRMMHESRLHKHNLFITLTLDDEHLNGNREVCPRDFSRFIKDLRKTQEGRISFFGCGEYGETYNRPHYHALLFGARLLDIDWNFDPARDNVGKSNTLDDIWGRGITEVGSVTMASATYVAGYIRKKAKLKDYNRANPFTGELLHPEFARMSLRPAIGKNWIDKYWQDVYPRDFVVVDGVEAKPPRYYDKFMDLEDEKGGCPERREVMETVRQRRYDDAVELSKYSLMSAEKTHEARLKLFSRRDTL